MTLLLNFTDGPRTRAVPSCAGSLPQKRKPRKKEKPLFRGGAGLHRGYIGRGLPGGSGCGFSKGFTDFNPAPDFSFLLRADDFAFFAFIRVSPLLAFRLLAWSPSSCLPPQLLAANRFALCCAARSLHATSAPIRTAKPENAMPLFLQHLPPTKCAVNRRLAPTAPTSCLISQ